MSDVITIILVAVCSFIAGVAVDRIGERGDIDKDKYW